MDKWMARLMDRLETGLLTLTGKTIRRMWADRQMPGNWITYYSRGDYQ